MTNREMNNYKKFPISDTHFHFIYPKEIDTTVDILRGYRDYLELESITLCAMSRSSFRLLDPVNNLKGLYCKSVLGKEKKNGIYVYGSPLHLYDERDTSEGYLQQVKELYEMGVDGYKIMDGKPTMRKKLGKPLCDPIFDEMYAFIEEKQMPVKMHLADPAKYWGDKSNISEYALAKGWYYGDGTYPTVEEFRSEVDGILTKFPKLKLCLAHFGYMTDDIRDTVRFLEKWENTSFDLTPGASNYLNFTMHPEEWKSFFKKYAHRLYLGSDTFNKLSENGEFDTGDFDIPRRMLEWPPERKVESVVGVLTPMNLPDEILKKIYDENRRELLKDARPLNVQAILKNARQQLELLQGDYYTMEFQEEKLLEVRNVEKIIKYFSEEKG